MDIGEIVNSVRIPNRLKDVLQSIALEGSGNILEIHEREGLPYSSTHRAIKALEDTGLIWCSKVHGNSSKSAQEYSLTPLGIIGSVVLCEFDEEVSNLYDKWSEYSPKFIKYWDHYKKNISKALFNEIILETFSDIYTLTKRNTKIKMYTNRILIIKRNSIDLHFLTKLYIKSTGDKFSAVLELCSKDNNYKKTWEKWFSVQRFKINYIEQLLKV